MNTTITDLLGKLNLKAEVCFLCSSTTKITEEHVFPLWLLKKYKIQTHTLTLLNGTPIKYNQLKIPCCAKCNNGDLSKLEIQISQSLERGYAGITSLPNLQLFQWFGKIFFGILRKEITLIADRKNPGSGSIIPENVVKGFPCLHDFLQSIRTPFKFPNGEPFSVLVAHLHTPDDSDRYYFRDSLDGMVCAMRLGDVGIIVALDDGGLLRDCLQPYLDQVSGRKLHPIQFDELYAQSLYLISRLVGGTKFAIRQDLKKECTSVHLMGAGQLSEGKPREYADLFKTLMQQRDPGLETTESGLALTWLKDQKGELILLNEIGERI